MIPLMSAERCWSQAMELKAQQEEQPDSRKRLHQIRRLAKVSPLATHSNTRLAKALPPALGTSTGHIACPGHRRLLTSCPRHSA